MKHLKHCFMQIIDIALGVIIAQAVFLIPVLLIKRNDLLKRKRKREVFESVEELQGDINELRELVNALDSRERIAWNGQIEYRKKFGALEVRFNDKQTVDKILMETVHNRINRSNEELDGIYKELKELTDRFSDLNEKIEVVGQNKPEPMPTDKRHGYDRFGEQFIKMVSLYVNEQETELGQAKAIQNIVEIMLSGSRQNREWWTKQVKTWAGVKK